MKFNTDNKSHGIATNSTETPLRNTKLENKSRSALVGGKGCFLNYTRQTEGNLCSTFRGFFQSFQVHSLDIEPCVCSHKNLVHGRRF